MRSKGLQSKAVSYTQQQSKALVKLLFTGFKKRELKPLAEIHTATAGERQRTQFNLSAPVLDTCSARNTPA